MGNLTLGEVFNNLLIWVSAQSLGKVIVVGIIVMVSWVVLKELLFKIATWMEGKY